MGEIILVASGKGGTGKSVFAVNMGAVLADKGYRVVLIDMDMGRETSICIWDFIIRLYIMCMMQQWECAA